MAWVLYYLFDFQVLGGVMEGNNFSSMSIDELWNLYQELAAVMGHKVTAEKAKLEDRLRKIEAVSNVARSDWVRRPHPKVSSKYQNPKNLPRLGSITGSNRIG